LGVADFLKLGVLAPRDQSRQRRQNRPLLTARSIPAKASALHPVVSLENDLLSQDEFPVRLKDILGGVPLFK
jgi:hypothetical protein